jgi:hypothetical protein
VWNIGEVPGVLKKAYLIELLHGGHPSVADVRLNTAMVAAALRRRRRTDDNVPGQRDEERPKKLEGGHLAGISCVIFEVSHERRETIGCFVTAATGTNAVH